MPDLNAQTETDPLCAWPRGDELHVLVGEQHHRKKITAQQMLWLAERFLRAGTEQMQADLRRREAAARLT